MQVIQGDLLAIKQGIIIHQVNNKHKMGRGLALQIRKAYPQHYQDYMAHSLELGSLVKTRINQKFGIIGLVGQDGYGTDRCYTDYQAFLKALLEIKALHDLKPRVQFYMPEHIGCSLAGGDWQIVSELIETYTPFIILVRQSQKGKF